MLIDTHCHLSSEYYDNINQIVEENKKASVSFMVVSGCDKSGIKEVLELKKKYDCVFATIGYHPDCADKITYNDLNVLKEQLKNDKIVGVGEIGLDYYYTKENRDKQLWLFEEQLKIAQELKLPVVIHSREATLDTINILKKYKLKGIIHCFSGSLETANIYIKMGYFLGIGGVVTFKNSKLKEVVKQISLDNIVLETDSPYLTPDPYRGKKNSSKYLNNIASYIANIKNINYEEVEKITSDNACKIFDFNIK